MSSVALTTDAVRPLITGDERDLRLELHAVRELVAAEEVSIGMARVVGMLRRACNAAKVEWWAADEDGVVRLRAADGTASGGFRRQRFPLGGEGLLVVVGGTCDRCFDALLSTLRPVLRQRCTEERLTCTALRLARRNAALDDFAALVAHELKAPLHAALAAGDASGSVEQALDLVDALLEAARSETAGQAFSTPADCLHEVLRELSPVGVDIRAELPSSFPFPAEALRVIFRNLLANAIAAGARKIHVSTDRSGGSLWLMVDDDGVGLVQGGRYEAGSGLGLHLCSKIAGRFGGVLELAPRPVRGARATLVVPEAA